MTPSEFYDAVRNGGMWDYKLQGSKYEELGKYNFAAIAAATSFLPGNIPNLGAGWPQQQAGT